MARGRRYKRKQSKSRRATRWLLVVGILALAALVAVICVERHRTVHSHIEIDREAYPVIGIDVSRNNGRIDFEKVHDHGIAFVFIKSSEGVTFQASCPASAQGWVEGGSLSLLSQVARWQASGTEFPECHRRHVARHAFGY